MSAEIDEVPADSDAVPPREDDMSALSNAVFDGGNSLSLGVDEVPAGIHAVPE